MPRSDLMAEQQAGSTLKGLFQQMRPLSEALESVCGYFLQDSLLVREWVQHSQGTDGNSVIQIVFPGKRH